VTAMTDTMVGPLDGRPIGAPILAAAAYTDPAVFAAERGAVFTDSWIWVGFEHWVPEPGTSHPISVAGSPLLPHPRSGRRAARLPQTSAGTAASCCPTPGARAKRLTCPYHAWSLRAGRVAVRRALLDRTPRQPPPTRRAALRSA